MVKNWLVNIEERRFAFRYKKNELYIPPEQFNNILNLDETCLFLDGGNGHRGGRPKVIFFDQRFIIMGKGTSKSTLNRTMVAQVLTVRIFMLLTVIIVCP